MNLKSLLATAMAVLLLVSCTKEVIKEVYVGGEDDPGTARIKINLVSDNVPKVKSANDHYGITPTQDELKIYNYALFIFNSSGMLEASLIQTIGKNENNYTPEIYNNSPLEFTQAENPEYIDDNGVITLTAGRKEFFAIVNAPLSLLARQAEFVSNNSLTRQVALSQLYEMTGLEGIVGTYGDENDPTDILWFDNPVTDTGENRGFMMTTLEANSGFIQNY